MISVNLGYIWEVNYRPNLLWKVWILRWASSSTRKVTWLAEVWREDHDEALETRIVEAGEHGWVSLTRTLQHQMLRDQSQESDDPDPRSLLTQVSQTPLLQTLTSGLRTVEAWNLLTLLEDTGQRSLVCCSCRGGKWRWRWRSQCPGWLRVRRETVGTEQQLLRQQQRGDSSHHSDHRDDDILTTVDQRTHEQLHSLQHSRTQQQRSLQPGGILGAREHFVCEDCYHRTLLSLMSRYLYIFIWRQEPTQTCSHYSQQHKVLQSYDNLFIAVVWTNNKRQYWVVNNFWSQIISSNIFFSCSKFGSLTGDQSQAPSDGLSESGWYPCIMKAVWGAENWEFWLVTGICSALSLARVLPVLMSFQVPLKQARNPDRLLVDFI